MNWRLKVLCSLIIGAFVLLSLGYYKFYVEPRTNGVILFIVPGLNLELLNLSGIDEETGAGSTPRLAWADRVALVNNQTESGMVNPAALISWLSTGQLGQPNQIGLDPAGSRLDNLVYQAQKSWRAVGVVSNTELDNPLLGCFFSHQTSILDQERIAKQLFDSTDFNVILGQRPRAFQSLLDTGDRNLTEEAELKGYRIVKSREELENVSLWRNKILGLFRYPDPPPPAVPVKPRTRSRVKDPATPPPAATPAEVIPPFPSMKDLVRQAIRSLQYSIRGYFLVVHFDLTDPKDRMSRAADAVARIRALNDAIAEARLYAGNNSSIILYVPYDLPQAVEVPPPNKNTPSRRRLVIPPAPSATASSIPQNSANNYESVPAGFGWVAFYGHNVNLPKGFLTPGELHEIIRSTF